MGMLVVGKIPKIRRARSCDGKLIEQLYLAADKTWAHETLPDQLSSPDAAVQVESPDQLADAVSRLNDPGAASKLTRAATEVCSQVEDITDFAAKVVLSHLPEERASACVNLDSGTNLQA